jgi:cellobiose epimerase
MNTETKLAELREAVSKNLTENILPFWMDHFKDEVNGGFLGRISGEGAVEPEAPKGAILNARILWAFSAAYRVLGRSDCRQMADRAFREIADRFYDREFGGVYWSLDAQGRPLDAKKQIYAIGFAIYGLSEYARATGQPEAKELAIRLFNDIEQHSFDPVNNGYLEALTREWEPIADMRLSEKDANERKTMNTHLHIIEPYTALYRVWPDEGLKERIKNLLYVFREKIMDKCSGHLQLFFDDYWNSRQDMVSYGHDIEASWLLHEAASVIGEDIDELLPDIVKIAAAASEGYVPGAGMMYEMHRGSGAIDADRHWWVQAETVVGYLNIYQLTGDEDALRKACETWEFIDKHLVDREGGEWHWSLKADGSINTVDDKAGFWKCPYHNSRMCLEIIERIK